MQGSKFNIGDRVKFKLNARASKGIVGEVLLRSIKARVDKRGKHSYLIIYRENDIVFITLPEGDLTHAKG